MDMKGVQRALEFFVGLPRINAEAGIAALPPCPDYEALARLGAASGYHFAADEGAEAFRILTGARFLAGVERGRHAH